MRPPKLRDQVDLTSLTTICESQAGEAGNIIGAGTSGQPFTRYLNWHENTEQSLASLIDRDDVAALLHTPRHWSLRAMAGDEPRIFADITAELRRCAAILREWETWSKKAHEWWRESVAVVPDTNYLLHCGKRLLDIDWQTEAQTPWCIRVVLTVTVLDEIDRHKRSAKDSVRATARQVFKDMRELGLLEPNARVPLHKAGDPQQRRGTIEVLPDALDHVRLPDADSEIVSRAEYLSTLTGRTSIVLTYDGGMAARTFLPNVDVMPKTQPGT